MSVVNWGEVYYSVWGARGEKAAKAKLQEIAQLPIEIVGVDMELGELAASLKAEHNLPYADCFAAALAQARKATLVTSDKDLERVGSTLRIIWARSRVPKAGARANNPELEGVGKSAQPASSLARRVIH